MIGGVDFLRSVALKEEIPLGERVIVIGGGNVAYDVARTLIRQTEYDVSRTALRQEGVKEVHLVCLESLYCKLSERDYHCSMCIHKMKDSLDSRSTHLNRPQPIE